MNANMNKLLAVPILLGLGLMSNNAQATSCDTTDVTFENFAVNPTVQIDSTDCSVGDPGGANPSVEESFINGIWGVGGTNAVYGSGDFLYAAKDNIGGTDESKTVLGVQWSLTFTSTTNSSGNTTPESGNWVLRWNDIGAVDLPKYFDIAVLFKGGPDDVTAYLFNELLIPVDPNNGNGTYEVNVTNRPGNFTALSHGSLFVRAGSTTNPPPPPPPSGVPEPSVLALMGLGAMGFGLNSRRKKQI